MRPLIPIGAAVLGVAVAAGAQDTSVKSRTNVDVEDGHAVSMTGCLRYDLATDRFTLHGTMAAGGDEVRTKTKVERDVDRDETTTRVESRAEADDAVGTAGVMTTFAVVAGHHVNLAPHVDRHVQLSAVTVDPDHKDADVEVRTETTVDPEDARDTTRRSKAKVELDRGVPGEYTIVSITPLGTGCLVD